MQQDKAKDSGDLLERVKSTPQEQLTRAVKNVEHLELDEGGEDRRKRGVRARNRETLAKIRRAFYWFLFCLACVVSTAAVIGLGYLTFIWISSFVTDPVRLEAFLKDVGLGLLIILATITVERLFPRDED